MKKGQKVRILRTNEIATIVEVELIRKGGKPDLWLDTSELGDIVEHCNITFKSDDGRKIIFDINRDHKKEQLGITITGQCPENIKEHHGLYVLMATTLLENLQKRN